MNPINPTNPKATFFILGWLAERFPHLVSEIHSRGHEVASHGFNHLLADQCSSDDLKRDIMDTKKLLEDFKECRFITCSEYLRETVYCSLTTSA